MDTVKIVIIHFNTPFLTDKLIRSINKYTPNSEIFVFDNSDKEPFENRFSNVTVFDNTYGNIINFDEWLEKYPTRLRSAGKGNNWASAKHCYTIQKCIELIGENFILIDSDVILTNDITPLFDEQYVYVGEVVKQPYSTVKRVHPCLCFINAKLCLEKRIKYFDQNYMHGLAYSVNNKLADSYDTGAAFYIHSGNFRHKEITVSDFCVHYGSGSWRTSKIKKYSKNKLVSMTQEEWAENYKIHWEGIMDTLKPYNKNKKKRGVIYTCVTGAYEMLDDPYVISPEFDYVCFTNYDGIKSKIWELRPIPEELDGYSEVKKQRCIKIMPHKYLPEYKLSIWVDGSVKLKKDVGSFIDKYCMNGNIFIPEHPQRKCIYKEMDICIKIKKDTADNILPMKKWYRSEGFPENYGLVQSSIIVRRHNEPDCKKLMEEWWDVLKDHSHRDQLSFDYVRWKNPDIKVTFLSKNTFKNEWFSWEKHKKPSTVKKTSNVAANIDEIMQRHYLKKTENSTAKKIKSVTTTNQVIRRHLISKNIKTFLKP